MNFLRTLSRLRLKQKWRWILPILLLLLFLLVLIWIPWQTQKIESSDRQDQLIADTLWVEQAIQFQLNRDQEILNLLGLEIINSRLPEKTVMERFQSLLKNNHEIQRLYWLDEQNKIIVSAPESSSIDQEMTDSILGKMRVVRGVNRVQCLIDTPEQTTIATLFCDIPMIHNGKTQGSIIVAYGLNNILEELVPWWFSQDNQISLINEDEHVFASRAAGGPGKGIYTHSRVLELPGLSLVLRTNSIKGEPHLLANFLVLSIIILALGLLWSLLALWRDINRRLATEGALRQEVTFRKAMENSLMTGLRARDMEGRMTYVNPAFCKMVGHSAEELIGKLPPMPYWAPEAFEEYQERFSRLLAGSVPNEGFETIYRRPDGERFPALIHESPLINEHGQQTGWMGSVTDISELKRAQDLSRQQEEKLHASARLSTMGEIASMMAHELNQPLAAISSYTTGAMNLIQSGNNDARLLQSALEKASLQAQRAGHIIRSVHDFVKKREPKREPVSMADLLHSILPLIELQTKPSYVALQIQLEPDLPMVLADRILLEQVILNLARNAIEAMQNIAPRQRILRIQVKSEQTGELPSVIMFEVIDHGHGISPEVAQHLFSPFFSTKSTGMGMGLNICRTTIEFHGGTLSHSDNPAGGSIFRFTLPVQQ